MTAIIFIKLLVITFLIRLFHDIAFRSSRNACNCPDSPNVGATMTLDHQIGGPEPRLLWIDASHNYIMAADMNACNCPLLVNTSVVGNAGMVYC